MQKPHLFNYKNILTLAVIISVSVYIFYKNFELDSLRYFSLQYLPFALLAFAMVVLQDCFSALRIYFLSEKKISFKNAFTASLLIQFANAITPPIASSTAIPMYIFSRGNIGWAKSMLIVVLNMILDQIMFIILIPLLWFIFGEARIFGFLHQSSKGFNQNIFGVLIFGYSSFLLVTGFISTILFISPRTAIEAVFYVLKRLKLLNFYLKIKPFLHQLYKVSFLLKNKPSVFWLKLAVITVFIWFLKFLCASFLLFPMLKEGEFFISVFRQYFLTLIQLAIPTPGGSGTAEMGFLYFFKDIIGNIETLPLIAAIWRIETFYYYIIIGIILFPIWLSMQRKKIDNLQ